MYFDKVVEQINLLTPRSALLFVETGLSAEKSSLLHHLSYFILLCKWLSHSPLLLWSTS